MGPCGLRLVGDGQGTLPNRARCEDERIIPNTVSVLEDNRAALATFLDLNRGDLTNLEDAVAIDEEFIKAVNPSLPCLRVEPIDSRDPAVLRYGALLVDHGA